MVLTKDVIKFIIKFIHQCKYAIFNIPTETMTYKSFCLPIFIEAVGMNSYYSMTVLDIFVRSYENIMVHVFRAYSPAYEYFFLN